GVWLVDSTGRARHLDLLNGLAGVEANRDGLFQDKQGHIWIGTNSGLSLYQTRYDQPARPPRIFLQEQRVVHGHLAVLEQTDDLVFSFLCLSFKNEQRIRLRYRLKGYTDWREVFPLGQPYLTFLDPKPGTYRLELQAANVEGIWSPIVTSKSVVVPTPFFQSWYFYLLVFLVLLTFLLIVAYSLFSRQLARRLEFRVRQKTKDLQRSEEKYRRLFTDSQDGIFITNFEGDLLEVNEAGLRMFEFADKQEALGINVIRDCYVNRTDAEHFWQLIKKQGYVRNFEVPMRTKTGRVLQIALSSTPIYGEDGRIVAFSGFLRDMTEWKRMQEQLAHSQRMESLGMLAGGVAHDFNNILAGILGYASLLKMQADKDEKLYQYGEIIEKSAQRAADLTQQLLIFSRKGQPNYRAVDLNAVVKEAVQLIRSTFPRTITIERKLAENLPRIVADPTQLNQLVINLCV
ncbi:PAS domain S-box protein, partial [Candidatus Parcubacteria bacterium]